MTSYKVNLLCYNCGVVRFYEIPRMKRLYGYKEPYYGYEGEILIPERWSAYGPPRNEDRNTPLVCTNCGIATLGQAPAIFGQNDVDNSPVRAYP